MTIYERIRTLRIAQGMSQFELAKKVGYKGRSAISKVEKGERDISQSMIEKYAAALGVSPSFLLYGEDFSVSESSDSRSEEFTKLFSQLTTDHQEAIVAAIKALLNAQ